MGLYRLYRSVRVDEPTQEVRVQTEINRCLPHRWEEYTDEYLTSLFQDGGYEALDEEMIEQLLWDSKISYTDPTTAPYRYALRSKAALEVFRKYGCAPNADERGFSCATEDVRRLREWDPDHYAALKSDLAALCKKSRERQKIQ